MILSGLEIKKNLNCGINISDFDESRLNPNSYNLRLANELLVYDTTDVLDMASPNTVRAMTIPEQGLVLHPNTLYLARTMEYTETTRFIPMIEGRSSCARLGLHVHISAGFGDLGFKGYWTLELQCVHPIRVYAGTEVCQIYYHTVEGEYESYTSGKYQENTGIQPSLLWRDFK